MHFGINYSTNERLHLLLIRWHIWLAMECSAVMQTYFRRFVVFDERYIFVQYVQPSAEDTNTNTLFTQDYNI